MLGAGYFHPISSRFAASVVGIDNDGEGQRSGYQLPPVAGQNSIKIGSVLREQNKIFTSSFCNAYNSQCSGLFRRRSFRRGSFRRAQIVARYFVVGHFFAGHFVVGLFRRVP
jgi:hypothetical protein